MATTRRQFIKQSAGAVSLSLVMPKLIFGQEQLPAAATNKVTVILQLGGANDGLNTVIPYTNSRYQSLRPNLKFTESDLASVSGQSFLLNGELGLTPGASELKTLYDQGKVAIVLGVGYPNPNLSHFSSTDIWMTANLSGSGLGWLGRYADRELKGKTGITAVSIGALPKILYANDVVVPSISNFAQFTFQTDARYASDRSNKLNTFKTNSSRQFETGSFIEAIAMEGMGAIASTDQVQAAVGTYRSTVTYPNTGLANSFKMIAQLAATIPAARLFHLSIGGFDNHSQQIGTNADQFSNKLAGAHYNLWRQVSGAVDAFYKDMAEHGLEDDTLVMSYSEFGRRPNENASRGTDHGTASVMFVVGKKVNGGLYGAQPSLETTALDSAGNMRFTTDFRSVYATVIDKWLESDSRAILGNTFANLSFL